MPKQAQVFARSVAAAGLVLAASAVILWQSELPGGFLVCLVLGAIASTMKVELPQVTGTLSPAFVFLLVSVASLSWSESVIIALASGAVQCFWCAKTRPRLLQVSFNAGALALSGALAHSVAHRLGGGGGEILRLGVAALVLQICNSVIVAMLLCLLNGTSVRAVWRSIQGWALPYYLVGAILARVWCDAGLATVSIELTVLAAVSAYLLSMAYREFVEKLTPSVRNGEPVSET